MGNIRTRITKQVGSVRTTTSYGGRRGVTTSMSVGSGKGVGRTRNTWSTNQKTGKTRFTQSQKIGENTWYVSSQTTGGYRKTKRNSKIKFDKDLFWIAVIFLFIVFALM